MWWMLAALIGGGCLSVLLPAFVGGAWSPTKAAVMHSMLELARLQPGETLWDLGAGDGRFLVAALERGAKVVGVEIDPIRWFICRLRCRRFKDRAQVIRGNMFHLSLEGADVVTFYLSQAAADRLRDKLERELKDGARVVSNRRPIPGWRPSRIDAKNQVYVYVIGEHHLEEGLEGV
ncbi:MAG: class I SAM-dependent methyltransferase [Limnochordia bacterium]|nr:methyltransferase domain-containing protein [Bacillota bacterium]